MLTDPFRSVIAGNHDLPLHDSWYEDPDNKRRFHGKRIEVCSPFLIHSPYEI